MVGAFSFNSIGPRSNIYTIFGGTSVQNSHFSLMHGLFNNCSADSYTGGAASGSLGSVSVYGGAFAVLQSLQVSEFSEGLLSPPRSMNLTGFNLTVVMVMSNFTECIALTNSTSVRPGVANGGGGAVYVSSVALANFSVSESHFISSMVFVACGATGTPSNSSGGALAVEVPGTGTSHSLVDISSCSFFNCSARGANISNLGVRGGAVAVSRATYVSLRNSNFTNCSIVDVVSSNSLSDNVVSGGAGVSVALAFSTSVDSCNFDATGGRDQSGSSTGLLVFAQQSSGSVEVSGSSFRSSAVALSVLCVSDDGFRLVDVRCDGPTLFLSDSRLQLLANSNASLSTLMTLQSRAIFSRSRIDCFLSEFAVFKSENLQRVEYFCNRCPTFFISTSATVVLLEQLSNASNVDHCIASSLPSIAPNSCPFGVPVCTTFAYVTSGFWTNFSNLGSLEIARRCPRGYCRCVNASNGACQLTPLLSIDRSSDPLCSANRTGKLCGGCLSNFTQSMDGVSCISNDVCTKNLWWVWTLSIVGFALYSLYVVVSCGGFDDGAFSCLLFYLQMSALASRRDDSKGSSIFEYSLIRSLLSSYTAACYAINTSAYSFTAAQLIGPLFILIFSIVWTRILHALQPWLQGRGIDVRVSYGGSLAATALFLFASVANVVFTLVQCTSYASDGSGVVFIDGTVACLDSTWRLLVIVSVLLCLVPFAFAAVLRLDKLSASARAAICRAYNDSMFYWGAVTLMFRLLMLILEFLQVDFPNLLAFMRSSLSTVMLVLLTNLHPYNVVHTFWVDVTCYICLIAQFGIQALTDSRDFFGINGDTDDNKLRFFDTLTDLSTVFR